MNIVYIDHYAGSPDMGMEFRPYYLAREWLKKGHNVRIVAGDYSHLRIKNPKHGPDFREEIIDGITYVWLRTGEYEGNGTERALTMMRFVEKLRKKASWIAKNWKPDVIITSSTYPLDTYAGQRIRSCCKKMGRQAILIHEIHDMWPITLTEIGDMSRFSPFVMAMQRAENSFCRKSDYVVSLLPAANTYLEKHGMAPEKFRVVTNGVVLEEWESSAGEGNGEGHSLSDADGGQSSKKTAEKGNGDEQSLSDTDGGLPEEHRALLNRLHAEGKSVICFFGSVNKAYAVDYLIHAKEMLTATGGAVNIAGSADSTVKNAGSAESAAKNTGSADSAVKIAIVIVGEGSEKENLMAMDVPDVYFLPRIPKTAIPALMEKIDICYVGGLKNKIFRFGIAMNKLFDSMMSGKPILYAVEAPNNYVLDYECGVSVEAENVEALADGIRTLMAMSPAERERLGKNGREAVLEHFSYEKLAEAFEAVWMGK